MSTKLTS